MSDSLVRLVRCSRLRVAIVAGLTPVVVGALVVAGCCTTPGGIFGGGSGGGPGVGSGGGPGAGSGGGSGGWTEPPPPAVYVPVVVELAGDVTCTSERTNLFNPDYTVTAAVRNLDTEAGIFTVQVYGQYPGGGDRLDGTGTITLAAGQSGTVRVDLHGAHGLVTLRCVLVPPRVSR